MSYDQCQELKNIKYKTMLLNGNKKLNITSITNDISKLDILLDEESEQNKKESWNKLDKSVKMKKITEYIKTLTIKHKLNDVEISSLNEFINSNLDKKNLQKNKDVIYIKESGKIENIPTLQFNNTSRKFSLKRTPQHVSTAKALGPTKNKTRSRSYQNKSPNSPKNESNKN